MSRVEIITEREGRRLPLFLNKVQHDLEDRVYEALFSNEISVLSVEYLFYELTFSYDSKRPKPNPKIGLSQTIKLIGEAERELHRLDMPKSSSRWKTIRAVTTPDNLSSALKYLGIMHHVYDVSDISLSVRDGSLPAPQLVRKPVSINSF